MLCVIPLWRGSPIWPRTIKSFGPSDFFVLPGAFVHIKKNEDTKLHRLFPFGYRNIQIDTQQQSTVSWGVHSNQLHVCRQTLEIRVCPKRKESLRLSHPLHTSCCIDRHLCCVVNQRFATGCDLLDLCRLCSCLLTPEVLLNYLRPMKTIQPNPIRLSLTKPLNHQNRPQIVPSQPPMKMH